ncbi:hypothetical protein F2Q70_00040447 [Brassica cretica]|uniref:Uncharacterized protein n=1 Tax=Brassica cretica TaxID=69181 RepID=A0A8S9K714_BRACR|nr:hypothetical protein F2Q70_00040447 [Brassica cretica]
MGLGRLRELGRAWARSYRSRTRPYRLGEVIRPLQRKKDSVSACPRLAKSKRNLIHKEEAYWMI